MDDLIDREEIDAVIACLGDDAAQLRNDNPDDERADNMDRAATLLQQLADDNSAIARILLDQDREGAKGWARGMHLNMDGNGALTATADAGVPEVGHACKLDGSICESRPDRCSDCPASKGKPHEARH